MADIFDGQRAFPTAESELRVWYVGHDSARGVHVFEDSSGVTHLVSDTPPREETDAERVDRRALVEAAGMSWAGSITHRLTTSDLDEFLACCFEVAG